MRAGTFLGYERLSSGGQANHNHGNACVFDLDAIIVSFLVKSSHYCYSDEVSCFIVCFNAA